MVLSYKKIDMDIVLLLFHLQKYIEEKVSPEEKLEWVKVHIGKGFAGKKILKEIWK